MKAQTKFKQTEIGMIPEDWEVVDLGVLGNFRNGINFNRNDFGNGYPVVNVKNLFRGRFSTIDELDEVKEGTIKNIEAYSLREGDILFARSSVKHAGAGQVAMVNQLPSKHTLFSGFIIRFRIQDIKRLNNNFLNYLLRSSIYREYLTRIATGTTITNLSQENLSQIPIILPNLQEQIAITKILSDLDSKIEINQEMNKTLEKIGQALFKFWFIDFEFPNEKGKPYRSSGGKMVDSEIGEIPKGWTEGRLGDICDITMGQSPPGSTYNESGDGMCFYQGITDFGFRLPSKRVFCTAPTRFAEEGDVLLSVRAPVGALNVAEERCAVGRGVASVRLKGKHNGFLYYLLLATKSRWETFEAEGTVFGAANKTDVHDFKIVIPPKPLIEKFASIVEPMDVAIRNSEKESRTLTGLRDSLLPRLMSGRIRVNNIGKSLEVSS